MSIFLCTCCGSEVTKPYFYGKGIYGYTCIKKVNPSFKNSKRQEILAKADSIFIDGSKIIALIYGVRFNITTYKQVCEVRENRPLELDAYQSQGYFLVSQDNKDVYKSIFKNADGLYIYKNENRPLEILKV